MLHAPWPAVGTTCGHRRPDPGPRSLKRVERDAVSKAGPSCPGCVNVVEARSPGEGGGEGEELPREKLRPKRPGAESDNGPEGESVQKAVPSCSAVRTQTEEMER